MFTGIPKLVHSWTSLSSLVGKEVLLRYHDQCRQLRWKHSSQVPFKVLISVTGDRNDRSGRVLEWFVRNPQQLKHGSAFQDSALVTITFLYLVFALVWVSLQGCRACGKIWNIEESRSSGRIMKNLLLTWENDFVFFLFFFVLFFLFFFYETRLS